MSLREMLAGGGGVKSIQEGFVSTTTVATGTAPQTRYVDITISAVVPAKCVVTFTGGFGVDGAQTSPVPFNQTPYSSSSGYISKAAAKVISATVLRIFTPATSATIGLVGQWTVVEYK